MEEKEISLKELFQVVWKKKYVILLFTFILFVVTFIGCSVYGKMKSEVGTIINLEWEGISEGEYPDGTRFEYINTFSPNIFSQAIQELGYTSLSSSDIRTHFTISPIVPSNIATSIENAIKKGEDYAYFATNYRLQLDYRGLGLTVEEARLLLTELIQTYRSDFDQKYNDQKVILSFTDASLEEYDYIDSYDILHRQVELIEAVISSKQAEGTSFVSPTLGVGFNDLLLRISLLKSIELDGIISRTNTYLLTKDVDYLITKYTYLNQVNQLELNKQLQKEIDTQLLIDNYKGSVTTIIIPGVDSDALLEIDPYYQVLLENMVKTQSLIAELEQDIAYNEMQIDRLSETDPTLQLSETQRETEVEKVTSLIESANNKLASFVEDANIMLSEYNTFTTAGIIRPLMVPEYQSNVSTTLYSLVGAVLGAGIGLVFVLFKHEW